MFFFVSITFDVETPLFSLFCTISYVQIDAKKKKGKRKIQKNGENGGNKHEFEKPYNIWSTQYLLKLKMSQT